ncbi:MAG TPA: murein transglycosylase A [Rhizomicrobium sp.]|nr:murein transglycosylase A [Rhizomicrobium sp.]
MRSRLLLALGLIALVAAGFAAWWFYRPAVPTPLTLTAVSFANLPGWDAADPSGALQAFRRSCVKLLAAPPQTAMAYAGTAADWRGPCADAGPARDARAFFESAFQPYVIGDGLVTGYYEPLLNGSRTRHGAYQTPVYGLPQDLVSVDLGLFRPEWKGTRIAGRLAGGRLVPYASRAEIDAHPPAKTRVLFYGDDPISVFFLHIQGSGRVWLDDGSLLRVNYAGQNGHPYTAVGRTLIARGVPREGMSMQVIRAWLKANPSAARSVMETDASFVFFQEEPVGDARLGPQGSEGVALTPRASIAVDMSVHPLGVPFFIAGDGIAGLFIAQDTGGAIRGAARADIFFGFGASAENTAGGMKARPRFYVLLPKGVAPRLSP